MYQLRFAKKIDRFEGNKVSKMECLFLEPITFAEAKSTDNRAMGSWTDNFEKTIFQNPLPRMISIKKGVGEITRAFCLGRTESIPAVYFCPKVFAKITRGVPFSKALSIPTQPALVFPNLK